MFPTAATLSGCNLIHKRATSRLDTDRRLSFHPLATIVGVG